MTPTLLDLLRAIDTPTVCNAIEAAEGRRGFDRFTRGTPFASNPTAPAMVGYARTATISGRKPPTEPADVIRARRMEDYRYMAEATPPAVAVIEHLDSAEAVSAHRGEIDVTVHKGFGLAGALTNGLVRDLGDLPPGFPVVAGSTGPSHAFVHVREIDVPVTAFGLTVAPGELIHADRHGAVVIPAGLTDRLEEAIRRTRQTERLVLAPARQPGFDFAAFAEAWEAFEKART